MNFYKIYEGDKIEYYNLVYCTYASTLDEVIDSLMALQRKPYHYYVHQYNELYWHLVGPNKEFYILEKSLLPGQLVEM